MTRACGVLHYRGRVLLQRKRGESIWAVPGGKVKEGESIVEGLLREWWEELGAKPGIGRLLWIIHNRFELAGRWIVQSEHYYELVVLKSDVCLFSDNIQPKDVTLEFGWFSPEELALIDFRPVVLRDRLFIKPDAPVQISL
jgi:8-oxo-dGTP pyrophosphatase MutT (NUDIX family)